MLKLVGDDAGFCLVDGMSSGDEMNRDVGKGC